MLSNTSRWSHARGNEVVPSPWQATPNEQAALKCLYRVTRSLDPTGGGRPRWVTRWKPALNAFAITFAGRFERTTH